MRKIIVFIGLNLALGTAHAEKTAVIPCTRTSDGAVIYEEVDLQDSARQFAIIDPRFFRVDRFKRTPGPSEDEGAKGTCIIHFMSEDEFNVKK
ncbi:hypothetical protein [Methylocystis echinoides]|uniref:Uncharacterized protein n=1 Tax=Methylocystis echinoides TaxID=29468 RepID=A0A9W6LT65_9HYPH|nr:hypothetical protein [Methylocystis echinoides]GLI94415.1 hypothetical protein LMG27198_34070 [Methylocystis echinoides]